MYEESVHLIANILAVWFDEFILQTKIVSEYHQEIPQLQIADKPMAPRGRATQPPRDTRKTNKAV